ncbi:hypothetical protein CHU92_07385 [Flavobacterium cyanobacteriorum]|uniref:TonB-dependent receptor n=1 Tax=Flavobacterium cyanobacteriorum TaxID=2022802 RepID=A0A255Z8S6_9FLAO|nr:TonB-dependent receptor [Flavobacterium cyanobacteriorum]OYQ37856.1 hypothetical protein CHU92_07385 [Flavobacterium cyanobacteriorum]
MNLKLLLLTLFFTALGFSQQNGTVTGTIADKDMANAPLPFATVTVKGTSITTNTDENGVYTLSVPAGNHRLVISFLGYSTDEVPVTVQANETVTVNHSLGSDSVKLEEVVLTTTRKKNTETALLLEMREAKQVVSAISAEQISKSTDGNAAEAVQRVPGVTIVDGRFVMIRGLSERYNNVLLNNSIAPSTEVDKRTFSFDLIPTSSLDKMVIYKTGSADKPGDFAGGIITVTTSESTAEFTKAEVGFGYRSGTTFEDQYRTEGSDTDWLGFDKSYRPLPDGFSSNPATGDVSASQANRLPNNFEPTRKTAFFDNGFGFGLGRRIRLSDNNSLFTINTISYSNSYQNLDRVFRRYTTLNPGEERPPLRDDFNDNVYSNTVRLNLLSNWILSLGSNTKIRFKNLFNQQGNDETLIRQGYNLLQRGPDDFIRNYYSFYQSRFIYTGQLEGEHNFATNKKLDWVVGYNTINDDTPDFRRVRTFQRLTEPNAPIRIFDSPSTNPFEAGRFYGELDEYSINNGVSFTYDIEREKEGEDIGNISLKGGYYASYRERDFSAKYFTYTIPVTIGEERRQELVLLPISEAFSSTYVNDVDGWLLSEGTRPTDSYKADNTYLAGYAQATIPLYKFDITAGVRVEHNVQTLDTSLDNGNNVNINNPITSVLPSFNIGYNLSERSIARVSYSRTVNRPEFRELAPFVFYDYVFDAPISGNPDLDVATIDNIDLRYEFYPTQGELISLGTFFKRFDKPIELNAIIAGGDSQQFKYANAKDATNYGLELEIKKSFRGLFDNIFFDRLSANINASYIISEVDLGTGPLAQDRTRALQGQSPYIINAALGYTDDKNLSVNVVYNRFGDRIFSVGDNNFPSWYELSRDNIDLTVSKKIYNTTFKLGIQDILNAKYRIYEDSNRDEKIREEDDNVVNSFRRGTRFTLSIGYNF